MRDQIQDYWRSFSFVGLVVAAIFFAGSVTPSLLPRTFVVQGILSGFAIATGYSIGVALVWTYVFLELKRPSVNVERFSKVVSSIAVTMLVVFVLSRITAWQNSIRSLMEMPVLESAYPYRTLLISLITAGILIAIVRTLICFAVWIASWLNRVVPRRVAMIGSVVIVLFTIFVVGDGLIVRWVLSAVDEAFLRIDGLVEDGVEQPSEPMVTGSPASRIEWETIGRQGKFFILDGPKQADIEAFHGEACLRPIRVYAGMNTGEDPAERARATLDELIRVNAFDRKILVVATPTGTGWLDPSAVDTLEYLHRGDTAIVSTQYSYLPSWISILVDPRRSIVSADALFDVIYGYWRTLPPDDRPRLYLHGLSLGSLGSERSTDLYTMFEDPIHGSVWSGPPFPSQAWNEIVAHRQPGSPAWLPVYRDSRLIRFTAQKNYLDDDKPWGKIRSVYIQYASDPMVFFSPSLLYRRPDWLEEPRGPDVSPKLRWVPIITFLQVAFDLPMATSIPLGYGHNYSPSSYIDAWIAVTEPDSWTNKDTDRLKERFRIK